MPKLKYQLPKLCKDRNQAYSWHNGQRVYHGKWGTPEAEAAFRRFVADPQPFLTEQCRLAITLNDVAAQYRDGINRNIGSILTVLSWGVENELVKVNTLTALREVKCLSKRTAGTFDHKKRREIADSVVRRTLPFMPPTIRAMVMIQRLTGMRPSEVCKMKSGRHRHAKRPRIVVLHTGSS